MVSPPTTRRREHRVELTGAPVDSSPCARLTNPERAHRGPRHRGADPRQARRDRGAGRRGLHGQDLLLVGVLKGAVMVMADFSRALPRPSRWTGWRSRRTGPARSPAASCRSARTSTGHPSAARAHRRGHHRLRPDAQLAARELRVARRGIRRGLRAAAQARGRQGRGATASTSASTSRTSSSSATASTTPRSTATCATSPSSHPHVYS